jgi:phosphopantothenoylcysteine decarboxylase/phosphopantothenate--cysteine ligase
MVEEKSFIRKSAGTKDDDIYDLHPSMDIKNSLGNELSGKKVVICVTASVGCYKAIDLIRLMMRHGADVFVVISKAVEKFMNREYFLWASGNSVISDLTGNLEHVRLANFKTSDLIIVYPCTANTIGKFANGIDDTSVTSVLSIALGARIPIIIAPAMHDAMYQNMIIKQNIQYLEKIGIVFVNPILEEDKAKVASIESVYLQSVDLIQNQISNSENGNTPTEDHLNWIFCKCPINTSVLFDDEQMRKLVENKKILISAGSTIEYIDPIRVISNTSSGKMGYFLLKKAVNLGLDVTLVKGSTMMDLEYTKLKDQFDFKIIEARTSQQMLDNIISELSLKSYDIIILAAAVSDFKPEFTSNDKITTNCDSFVIRLVPTTKIVNQVKCLQKNAFLVAFKAEFQVSDRILLERSYQKLLDSDADMIVANDVGGKGAFVGSDSNKILVLDKLRNYYDFPLQNKESVAENILKLIYINLFKQ